VHLKFRHDRLLRNLLKRLLWLRLVVESVLRRDGASVDEFRTPTAMRTNATKLKNPKGELPPRNGIEKMNPKNWMARKAPPMIVSLTPFARSSWRRLSANEGIPGACCDAPLN
jgi:hypothetical protein